MKTPTSLLNRPGRVAAVVGALVAVSATTMMALVAGTAAAAEMGHCVENVNVRAEPDATSRIVALCEAGTEVEVGETHDGYVELTGLGGWAAADYVAVDAPAADSTPRAPGFTPAAEAGDRDAQNSDAQGTDAQGTDAQGTDARSRVADAGHDNSAVGGAGMTTEPGPGTVGSEETVPGTDSVVTDGAAPEQAVSGPANPAAAQNPLSGPLGGLIGG